MSLIPAHKRQSGRIRPACYRATEKPCLKKNEQKTQGGGGKDRKVRNIPKDTGIKTPTLWIWEAWERETRKGAALDSAGEERRSVTFRPLLFFF